MRISLPLLLLLAVSVSLEAQIAVTAVDMDAVEARFGGSTGSSAYAQLIDKWNSGAPLALSDYRNIYYGSAFQASHDRRDYVQTRELAKWMTVARAADLVARCDSILALRPADLAGNYFKGLGLFLLDTLSTDAVTYRNRYASLTEAILSSGSGAGCGSAILVLSNQDALEVMRFLGIPGVTGEQREEDCQVFRIRSSPIYKADQIHFDMRYAAATAQGLEPENGGGKKGSKSSGKGKR